MSHGAAVSQDGVATVHAGLCTVVAAFGNIVQNWRVKSKGRVALSFKLIKPRSLGRVWWNFRWLSF